MVDNKEIINNNVWIFRAVSAPLSPQFVGLVRMLVARTAITVLEGRQDRLEPVYNMLNNAVEDKVPEPVMFAFFCFFTFLTGVRDTCQQQMAESGGDTSYFATLTEFVRLTVLTLLRSQETKDTSSMRALARMVSPPILGHDYATMQRYTQVMNDAILKDTANVRTIASERKRSTAKNLRPTDANERKQFSAKDQAAMDSYNELLDQFSNALRLDAVNPDTIDEMFCSDEQRAHSSSAFSPNYRNNPADDSDYDSDSSAASDSDLYDYDSDNELSSTSVASASDLVSLLPELSRFVI